GVTIGYNPDFILEQAGPNHKLIGKIQGTLVHEIEHVVLSHHLRMPEGIGADSQLFKRWNEACDYAINPLILDAGYQLPDGSLNDIAFHGMAAEEIFRRLNRRPSSGGAGGPGEVRPLPNPDALDQAATPAQIAEHEAMMKVAIQQAATIALVEGKLPAWIKEMVDKILKPKVDWRVVLQRFLSRLAKSDYMWMPPNKRYIHMGLYLPSVRSMELESGVLVIDTSASTYEHREQFAGELNGVLEQFPTELTVLYVDTDVRKVDHFFQDNFPVKFVEMHGGGGTNFSPAFDWVRNYYPGDPGFLIYLTDLECHDYPKKAPGYPVLWVKTSDGRGDDPPWGELVNMGVAT
ncbi:MAG: VWA-like domain-containing protein, partial [Desulfatirhabdiaceae bacterium]